MKMEADHLRRSELDVLVWYTSTEDGQDLLSGDTSPQQCVSEILVQYRVFSR